jgi:hypothetical protein
MRRIRDRRQLRAAQLTGGVRDRLRAVAAVTDTELLCEVVDHGQVRRVVVAHHDTRFGILNAASGKRLRIARGEPVHRAAVDLPIDRRRRVLRIPTFIGEVRRAEMADRVAPAAEVVSHPRPKTIDLLRAHPRAKGNRACDRRSDSPTSARRCARSAQDHWAQRQSPTASFTRSSGVVVNQSGAQDLGLLGPELRVGQHARLAQLTELLELRKLVTHVR